MRSVSIGGRLRRLLGAAGNRVSRHEPQVESDRMSRVTVVVATHGARSADLQECLRALRADEHEGLEVLVAVDDPDGPHAALTRRHAQQDPRIRLLEAPATTVAAARNQVAAAARGEYLTFLRPEDTFAASALHRLVRHLDATGSAFAFGRLVEEVGFDRTVADPVDPAHASTRLGVALATFPMAAADTAEENRVYRTDFWRRAGLVFPDEPGPGPGLQALLAADSFDVLAEVTCRRRGPGAGVPGDPLRNHLDGLAGWLRTQEAVAAFLTARHRPDLVAAWAFSVCDAAVVPLLDDAERATPEQWQELRRFLGGVRRQLPDRTWRLVRAEAKVKVWLAVEDRRDALEQLVADQLFEQGNRRTEVVDGRVLAVWPGLDVPADCREMSERETPLRVHLHSAHWTDPTSLELVVLAYADFVGFPPGFPHSDNDAHPGLRAWLAGPGRGRRVELRVEALPPDGVGVEANVRAGHRYQDYAPGAARVVLDASRLPPPRPGSGRTDWHLHVELDVLGVRRTGTITSHDQSGTAGLLHDPVHAPRLIPSGGGPQAWPARSVSLRQQPLGGLVVRVTPPPAVQAVELRVEARTVSGVIAVPGSAVHGGALSGATVVATGPQGLRAAAPLSPIGADRASFTLELPAPERLDRRRHPRRRWTLQVVPGPGAESGASPSAQPIGYPLDADQPADQPAGSGAPLAGALLVAGRDRRGHVQLHETVRTLLLREVELAAGEVRIRGRWLGPPPARCSVTLRGRRAVVRAAGTTGPGTSDPGTTDPGPSGWEAVVPTVWDEWGLGQSPVPTGVYDIEVAAGRLDVRVVLEAPLLEGLLHSQVTEDFRLTPIVTRRGFAVRLARALHDDERGAFAQRRLQQWCLSDAVGVDPHAVYLQSYNGRIASDSQLGIHEELRRSRPDLTVYWGVQSSATAAPEGGVALLMHSRRWYEVLGSATYLSNNTGFDRWHRRKPHQRSMQTFHGYPGKRMGFTNWQAKGWTPRRIELELDHTSRDWTLILTPAPEMDRYYREEYAYDGDIENRGYPRDDALLAPGAGAVRERTRRLLGIEAHQTAVLYAPTWRESQATSPRSARLTRHLDLESASRALGEDYVLLMRAHRFHARHGDRTRRSARLVDVTDYPEVNDLILAADAAVVDYSSLRFDFALTGRPMIFLVPDLEDYVGARGFLYPFEDTAPGPLLRDAAEVVEALQDLPRVAREHAAAYQRFQQAYNHRQDGQASVRVVRRFFT